MSEGLPEGWSVKPLGELAQVVSGGTPSRNVPYFWEEGSIPWVTPTDITATRGKYLSESKDRITKLGLMGCSASLLPSGSILMTSRATLGEAKISMMPACTNQGFKSLIAKPGVSNEFLYYQIQRTKQQYARFGSGSTFLEVGKKDTDAFPVMIPDEASQGKIAELLSLIDTQIEATYGLFAKQERVRAGLMQDLFTRGVDQHGQLRPHRDEAPQLYHQTELGWLPLGWEVRSFEKLVDPNRPISYGILMPGHHVPDGVPVIKVRDIRGGEIMQGGLLRTSKEIDAEYARSRLKENDLLMTIRGTVGRTAIVPPELAGANITQDTARLAIAHGSSDFFREFLSCHSASIYLQNNTLGQAVQGINLRDVKSMVAPSPPEIEQTEIAARLKAHRKFSGALSAELQVLRLQKSGLMQDLLTGQVSVAPLLERALESVPA
jgi:type I restriction enzyme S subunit